jgi:hypothetical protein
LWHQLCATLDERSSAKRAPLHSQPMTDAIADIRADIRADIIGVDLSEMNSVLDVSKVGWSDL